MLASILMEDYLEKLKETAAHLGKPTERQFQCALGIASEAWAMLYDRALLYPDRNSPDLARFSNALDPFERALISNRTTENAKYLERIRWYKSLASKLQHEGVEAVNDAIQRQIAKLETR